MLNLQMGIIRPCRKACLICSVFPNKNLLETPATGNRETLFIIRCYLVFHFFSNKIGNSVPFASGWTRSSYCRLRKRSGRQTRSCSTTLTSAIPHRLRLFQPLVHKHPPVFGATAANERRRRRVGSNSSVHPARGRSQSRPAD